MRFLDTNVLLRYLTRDDEAKANACLELLRRLEAGEEEVTTCEAIIAEVVYVLSSRALYHLSHEDIRARPAPILSLRGLKLPQKRLYLRALNLYASHAFLDFEDALAAAHMQRAGVTELYSYDTDFDRLPGLQRVEP